MQRRIMQNNCSGDFTMKRTLLDTSAYGELVIEPEIVKIIRKLDESHELIFYGNKLIRNELRDTPKEKIIEDGKLRLLMLELYDSLVSKPSRELKITDLIEIIANEYFLAYKKARGGFSYNVIINDFRIIACASLHNLDIVVSHDKKSMLSDKSVQGYKKVNEKFQISTPDFKTYEDFRNKLKNWRLP